MDAPAQVGFYGKLPSHGDFLRRRVSDGFVSAWDRWLQEGMAATRTALGDRWLEVYLTSPVWRFACEAGACGPLPVLGVMAPSVDRVGRYFPMTIVADRPEGTSVFEAFEAARFFEGAERLIIRTLEADTVDFDEFDERAGALVDCFEAADDRGRLALEPSAADVLGKDPPEVFRIPLESPDQMGRALGQLAARRLEALYGPLIVFWTEGSSLIDASCLVSKGLPDPERFVAMLDGQWPRRRWVSVSARLDADGTVDDQTIGISTICQFRSAGGSHLGKVREKNQDAFLERPDVGVWAVADGLGGHNDGEIASRMVCDALADWAPDFNFDRTITDARGASVTSDATLTVPQVFTSITIAPAIRPPASSSTWSPSPPTTTPARSYPCRSLESATKLVARFIAGVVKPRQPKQADPTPADPVAEPVETAVAA